MRGRDKVELLIQRHIVDIPVVIKLSNAANIRLSLTSYDANENRNYIEYPSIL